MLVTDAYGAGGGIAQCNRNMIEALAQMDGVQQVVVLSLSAAGSERSPEKKVELVAARGRSRVDFCREAIRLWRSGGFESLIVGHVNLLPVAALLNGLRRRPVALMVHGIEVWEKPGWIARLALRSVSRVWSVSQVSASRMNQWAHLPSDKFTVIPNAIRLADFGAEHVQPELLSRFRLGEGRALLTVARLSSTERYKGIDKVLELMPKLLQRDKTLRYWIAGDGEDLRRLKAKAEALGVSAEVHFLGMVSDAERLALYHAASAFVMPGSGEGFGIVYLEALACGTPVVASVADGSREAVLDGQLGQLADPDDAESIERAIWAALNEPSVNVAKLQHFDWSAHAQRVANAHHGLLPDQKP